MSITHYQKQTILMTHYFKCYVLSFNIGIKYILVILHQITDKMK